MSRGKEFFVGWDVGGWNCDRNRNSRDAVCVLHREANLEIVGDVSRGNIRDHINRHKSISSLLNDFCHTNISENDTVYLAIDTPLGFSTTFRNLLTNRAVVDLVPDNYSKNPYLYRKTEYWLFENGFTPLSAVKDMIGSQSTKGMHLLARIDAKTSPYQVGIWTNSTTTAIEAYPTTCKSSSAMAALRAGLTLDKLRHEDEFDAVYCALTAFVFATQRGQLVGPIADIDHEEGWIWVPADAIKSKEQPE